MKQIHIGLSACLLGQQVRYNGGHKRNDGILNQLGPNVVWIPVCPEVELGLGVPREPIHLVRPLGPVHREALPRLLGVQSRRDISKPMRAFADARVATLASEPLAGYILKAKSPSCGLRGVEVHADPSEPSSASLSTEHHARGLFAAALIARFPDLPIVEEHELNHPQARKTFLDRVRDYHAHHVVGRFHKR